MCKGLIMPRDSSDDDSDSDFEPGDVGDSGVEETKGKQEKKESTRRVAERKRRVEEAWAELQSQNTITRASLEADNGGPQKKKAKTVSKKAQAVLAGIFGTQTASGLVKGVGLKSLMAPAALPERKLQMPTKTTVTEKFKYAGKDIEVKRTVEAGASAGGAKKKSKGELDKVLEELKGPESISTVAKSSYDWDSFKQEKGLEDELAQVTKDGYLHRKDFLERCDVRQFEQERDARNVRRAQQAAAQAASDK